MAARKVRVTLSPQAEAYLLRKWDELSAKQQQHAETLLLEIERNPYLGEQHHRSCPTTASMGTFLYAERHIGEQKFLRLHHDLVIHGNGVIGIQIKSAWIGYKM